MGNWLNDIADANEQFENHGAELFRELKVACKAAVDTYNKRFAPKSAELIDCAPVNPNCFRVRTLNTQPERVVEVELKPQIKAISVTRTPDSNVAGIKGNVTIENDKGKLKFKIPSDKGPFSDTSYSFEDSEMMSRELLRPFFFPESLQS